MSQGRSCGIGLAAWEGPRSMPAGSWRYGQPAGIWRLAFVADPLLAWKREFFVREARGDGLDAARRLWYPVRP